MTKPPSAKLDALAKMRQDEFAKTPTPKAPKIKREPKKPSK